MYQDNLEYAQRRLQDTIISVAVTKDPFHVHTVRGEGRAMQVVGENLVARETEVHLLSGMDLEPIRLGFVNTTSGALFLKRRPMRRDWRQGLSSNSLEVIGDNRRDFGWGMVVQCALGRYPTLRVALDRVVNGRKTAVAFHQEWAVNANLDLIYRINKVGTVVDGIPVLSAANHFLSQALDEVINERA